MSNIWITPSGSLGTYNNFSLITPVTLNAGAGSVFSLIAGSLPPGVQLNTTTGILSGSTGQTFSPSVYNFVIRANNGSQINDRSFSIALTGTNGPEWITPAGYLPIGPAGEYYVYNNSFVDYTITARELELPAGKSLIYRLTNLEGILPPGLKLTTDGRIVGIVQDDLTTFSSNTQISGYDNFGYDSGGYDSVIVIASTQTASSVISKIYVFTVTVSDGVNSVDRQFRIKIDNPLDYTADTTVLDASDEIETPSIASLIPPEWWNGQDRLLPNIQNLGMYYYGGYLNLPLDIYDSQNGAGVVKYQFGSPVNPETILISNNLPDRYNHYTRNLQGQTSVVIDFTTKPPIVGNYLRFLDFFVEEAPYGSTLPSTELLSKTYAITSVVHDYATGTYILGIDRPLDFDLFNGLMFYAGSLNSPPPGVTVDINSGALYGYLLASGTGPKSFRFTVRAIKYSADSLTDSFSDQIFDISLVSRQEDPIFIDSPMNLGVINTGVQSEVSILAHQMSGNKLFGYSIVAGSLPPGLILSSIGEITGSINGNSLTRFDFTMDSNTTTIDRVFYFDAIVTDPPKINQKLAHFSITVVYQGQSSGTKVYIEPMWSSDTNQLYQNLISDQAIIPTNVIYRTLDPAYGLRFNPFLPLVEGIELASILDLNSALQGKFHRKTLVLEDFISISVPVSGNLDSYDVVAMKFLDEAGNDLEFSFSPRGSQPSSLSPNTMAQLRNILENLVINNSILTINQMVASRYRAFINENDNVIPIAFVKTGEGSVIVSKIKNSGMDFLPFNFGFDRIIFDQTLENTGRKYVRFNETL